MRKFTQAVALAGSLGLATPTAYAEDPNTSNESTESSEAVDQYIEQLRGAIKDIQVYCQGFTAGLVLEGTLKDEYLGNKTLRDRELAVYLQDAESASLEWCMNTALNLETGLQVSCKVTDRNNYRLSCDLVIELEEKPIS